MHGYGLMVDLQLALAFGTGSKALGTRRPSSAPPPSASVARVKLGIAGEVSGAPGHRPERLRALPGALVREAGPASARAREVAPDRLRVRPRRLHRAAGAEAVHVEVAMDVIAAKSGLDHALIDLDRAVGSPVARRPLAPGPADR